MCVLVVEDNNVVPFLHSIADWFAIVADRLNCVPRQIGVFPDIAETVGAGLTNTAVFADVMLGHDEVEDTITVYVPELAVVAEEMLNEEELVPTFVVPAFHW